jgi:hypothetical protein
LRARARVTTRFPLDFNILMVCVRHLDFWYLSIISFFSFTRLVNHHHGNISPQSFLSSRLHLLLRWMRIWKHCVWLCYHPWLFVLPTLTLPSPGCSITWLRCHEDESRQGWNLPGGMFVYGFGAHRTGKDLCLCEATLLLLLVSMKQLHWVDVRISFLSYSCVFSVGSWLLAQSRLRHLLFTMLPEGWLLPPTTRVRGFGKVDRQAHYSGTYFGSTSFGGDGDETWLWISPWMRLSLFVFPKSTTLYLQRPRYI